MSKEINVEELLRTKYGSTDSEFIKELPVNAVYYAKGNYFDIRGLGGRDDKSSRTYLSERINKIEDFINNETNWNLISGYVDIPGISVHRHLDDIAGYGWMADKIALRRLIEDSCINSNFSIIVIEDIDQFTRFISYLGDLIEELASDEIFVFCLEIDRIITFTNKDLYPDFSKRAI